SVLPDLSDCRETLPEHYSIQQFRFRTLRIDSEYASSCWVHIPYSPRIYRWLGESAPMVAKRTYRPYLLRNHNLRLKNLLDRASENLKSSFRLVPLRHPSESFQS